MLLLDEPGPLLLFLSAHESVADGWSLWVLLAEIVERAAARLEGRPAVVPEALASYADLARLERARNGNDPQLAYWQSRLAGLPAPAPLPANTRLHPRSRSVRGRIHTFAVPAEIVARLRLQAALDQGGSLLLLPLLASYAVWLRGLSGSADFVVGIPASNRLQPEHQGIVAPLASYLPIRFTLTHDPSFAELLGTTFQQVSEGSQGPAPSVAALVARLWPERLLDRDPLFRFAFFLQDLSANGTSGADVQAMAAWQPAALAARHDLALTFVVGSEQVVGRVEYAADLFSLGTVAEWFAGYVELLRAASAAPERPISSFLAVLPVRPSRPAEPPRQPVPAPPAAPASPAPAPPRSAVSAASPPPPPAAAGDAAAQQEAVEQLLAVIWKDVLKVATVEPDNSFFLLGGHSLLAMQVHSSLLEALGFEVPMRLQFDALNLRTLAKGVLEALPDRAAGAAAAGVWLRGRTTGTSTATAASQPAPAAVPPAPTPGAGSIPAVEPLGPPAATAPASFNQQRLWFLDQLEPGNAFYNLHLVLKLPGYLNRSALHRTLAEIVRRHEALRTTFATDEAGELVQVIHAPGELAMPFDDLSASPPAERTAALERLVLAAVHTPFDLARDPLFRVHLLRVAEHEHLLILIMHHIVVDAWSVGVLTHEVQALYQAFASGRPSPLPPLKRQYADFARWQREMLQGEKLERLLTYWKRQLAGAPPVLELPTDRPRPALQSFSGAMFAFELDVEAAAAVAELGRRERATPFMVMLAAFAATLSRYARQEDVVIGSPIANRGLAEHAPLIGFFNNTLVLRVDLSGDPSFTTLVRRVRSMTIDAYDHQDLPFERLVDELQLERNLSQNPLFQVLFSFDSDLGPRLAKSDGDDLPEVHSGTAKFDLGLYTFNTDRGLGGAFEYNTDLFDRRRIERMAEHLRALVAAAGASPEAPLSQVEMVSADERAELLGCSRPASFIPAEGCARRALCPPGRPVPGRGRRELQRRHHDLRRARCRGQPAIPPAAPGGRRSRRSRGTLRRALVRPAHRLPRHFEGRRRLRADRSQLSARADRLHARGCGHFDPADPERGRRPAAPGSGNDPAVSRSTRRAVGGRARDGA